MEDDFPQWYTDVITKTDLVDYAPVKGFMVVKPYGYALWEKMQEFMDKNLKKLDTKLLFSIINTREFIKQRSRTR